MSTGLSGCGTTPLTPSQTAQHFWAAVLNGDADQASNYATRDSRSLLKEQGHLEQYQQATIAFGQVSIKSDQATVETTLKTEQSAAAPQSVTFDTVLQREKEHWRVHYPQTRQLLAKTREKKDLDKMVDDLNQLGRRFSGKLNESLEDLREATPELKRDLEALGESVQKDMQDALEKYGPEIERNLQDLTESLEGALKQLDKSMREYKKDQQQPDQENAEPEQQPEGRMI
ncbi:MAG: hypothetical protein PVF34_07130 [Gammaproteobacteria bacterium]|jgi:uncharacterized membrane protein YccC